MTTLVNGGYAAPPKYDEFDSLDELADTVARLMARPQGLDYRTPYGHHLASEYERLFKIQPAAVSSHRSVDEY